MKKLIAMILALLMVLSTTGCGNYTYFDFQYTFNRAIIQLPDGEVVEGKIDSWTDYEGDQLQIEIDGTVYLVHAANAVMIAE